MIAILADGGTPVRFSEVARRLMHTFWGDLEPGEAKGASARRVLGYLEDRQALFAPWNVEVPEDFLAQRDDSPPQRREPLTQEP